MKFREPGHLAEHGIGDRRQSPGTANFRHWPRK
jgi:hypothetical protein